jgi:hypothetical protein
LTQTNTGKVLAMSTVESTVSYRPVTGFPGYRVGDDGSVWSCLKHVPVRGPGSKGKWQTVETPEWRRLAPIVTGKSRYLVVNQFSAGRRCQRFISRLVLEAFVGPCPPGMECCHNDGDPTNNRLGNLRWDSHRSNMADKTRHGTSQHGERNGKAKLTAEIVQRIRSEYAAGSTSYNALAAKYVVSPRHVVNILRRKVWKHI